MLDQLFKFPIVMIDGDIEEKKQQEKERMGLSTEGDSDEPEMIFAEAEYPCFDFIGIEDRWLPTDESYEKAVTGKFDACVVRFANVGQLLCPWTKKKFKAELSKFIDVVGTKIFNDKAVKPLKILNISPEKFKQLTDEAPEE